MKTYLFLMVLVVVLAIPLFATPVQDNTGTNFLRISTINRQEVGLNQAVSAPVYIYEAILPGKQKLFSILEFSDLSTRSIFNSISTVIPNNTNKFGGRRIKSGRH